MSSREASTIGILIMAVFVVIIFIVMGCLFYINWIFYKQRRDNEIGGGHSLGIGRTRCGYNRSSNIYFSIFFLFICCGLIHFNKYIIISL